MAELCGTGGISVWSGKLIAIFAAFRLGKAGMVRRFGNHNPMAFIESRVVAVGKWRPGCGSFMDCKNLMSFGWGLPAQEMPSRRPVFVDLGRWLPRGQSRELVKGRVKVLQSFGCIWYS